MMVKNTPHPNMPLHGHGVYPCVDEGPHEGDGLEFVLPHSVVGPGTSESHRFPNGLQEIRAQAGLGAELSIGLRGQPTEPVPERGVEEREGKLTALNGRTHRLQRYPTLLEPMNEARSPNVSAREW